MPRVKKRNDTGGEIRISAAIKSLNEGKQESIRAAAEAVDVPKSTLYYRYTGERTSHQLAQVDNQLITVMEEKAIVAWCKEQDDRGFPPRLDMVKDIISKTNSLHSEHPVHQKHRTIERNLKWRIRTQPWYHTTHQTQLNAAPKTQDAPDAAPNTQDAPDAAPNTQDAPDAAPNTQDAT